MRYVQLDDRLVVQWALPYDDCSNLSSAPSPSFAGDLPPPRSASFLKASTEHHISFKLVAQQEAVKGINPDSVGRFEESASHLQSQIAIVMAHF